MIGSFKGKIASFVWKRERSKLSSDVQRKALRQLMLVHRAAAIEDLRIPPGNRLKILSGDRKGQFFIRVNDQWRICFVWDGENAHHVEIVDYH